ncbi:MAG TPA: 2Fe-2S iron-sulfur cluster-binding protein [Longimicrobiales bacterium]|nr:2Fe-2S iron-sulfur cluster-binding protein [Longimicrobiales bacterium]
MAEQATETVTATIDGREITVAKGTRIIEAAEAAGIGIAHYCYHPGLSAPAMCRMCLVEVEGAPKLQPACVTPVAEGSVIRTEADKPREARQGVLEFYLQNHPLDCPICDKSGECKLQDYTYAEGRKRGRSLEPKRVLGQDDFGGNIVYDGDRCIMCTRCVRFMREVAQDDLLGVVQRGSRSVIDTFFEEGLDGSPFAGNIIDICPVGALLSTDFHHKARVWDLDRTPSICASCSQGCNISVDTRDNVVQRLRPRANSAVNSYWMCDYGRTNYEWMNPAARLERPHVRDRRSEAVAAGSGAASGAAEVGWEAAIIALVDRLSAVDNSASILAVGSPFHSNEDNALLLRLARRVGGSVHAVFRSPRAENEDVLPGFPTLVRRRDLAANVRGLELLGFERVGDDEARGGLDGADAAVVLVLGDPLADRDAGFADDAELFVYLGTVPSQAGARADFQLPVTSHAEEDGTFTNALGRVQRFWQALRGPSLARPAWQVLGVTLAGLGAGAAPATAADAFLSLGEENGAFAGLSYAGLGMRGSQAQGAEPVAAGAGAGAEAP